MTIDDEFDREWTQEEKAAALEFLAAPEFRSLTKTERTRLLYVLKTPGGQEREMLKRIWGRTPSQALRLMAQEFAERFGSPDASAYLDFVIQRLRPSHTWEKLDIKIAAFAQSLYHVNDMEGALDFWDKMRYLLQALPKRPPKKEWDENPGAALKLQKPKERWRYAVCDLCWRTVPLNTDSKKRVKPLCFEHDLPPGSPTYRKHERLKAQVLATAHELEKELQAIYPPSFADADDRKKFRALNWEHLTGDASPLENLTAYIPGEAERLRSDRPGLGRPLHSRPGNFPRPL